MTENDQDDGNGTKTVKRWDSSFCHEGCTKPELLKVRARALPCQPEPADWVVEESIWQKSHAETAFKIHRQGLSQAICSVIGAG
jgi:hypothetical protein